MIFNVQPGLRSTLWQICLLLKGLCITFLKSVFIAILLPQQLGRRVRSASPTKESSMVSLKCHTREGLHRSPGHQNAWKRPRKQTSIAVYYQGWSPDPDAGSSQPASLGFSVRSSIGRPPSALDLHPILTLPVFPHLILSSGC